MVVYELAADTESDVEPDDDSLDSGADLPFTSATSDRGGLRDSKDKKSRKRTGTAI